jgi:hypothetical protein
MAAKPGFGPEEEVVDRAGPEAGVQPDPLDFLVLDSRDEVPELPCSYRIDAGIEFIHHVSDPDRKARPTLASRLNAFSARIVVVCLGGRGGPN